MRKEVCGVWFDIWFLGGLVQAALEGQWRGVPSLEVVLNDELQVIDVCLLFRLRSHDVRMVQWCLSVNEKDLIWFPWPNFQKVQKCMHMLLMSVNKVMAGSKKLDSLFLNVWASLLAAKSAGVVSSRVRDTSGQKLTHVMQKVAQSSFPHPYNLSPKYHRLLIIRFHSVCRPRNLRWGRFGEIKIDKNWNKSATETSKAMPPH